MVQKPGEKPQHGIVLSGGQGIGKDTLLKFIRDAVGEGNRRAISPDQLFGRFKSWAQSILLTIDEVRDADQKTKAALYEEAKTLLATADRLFGIEPKGGKIYYIRLCLRVIFTTNSPQGLHIPKDDRRLMVMHSDHPAVVEPGAFPPGYFDRLHAWMDSGGVNAVAGFLRRIDVSGWNAFSAAPMTRAKAQLMSLANQVRRNLRDDVLDAFFERGCNGAPPDVLRLADIIDWTSTVKGLFDDREAALKALRSSQFVYQMRERGYHVTDEGAYYKAELSEAEVVEAVAAARAHRWLPKSALVEEGDEGKGNVVPMAKG